jgi:CRP/FNR family transcriptional regulator, cyclic AMP receptor protein
MSTLSKATIEQLKPTARSLLRTYQVRSTRSSDLVTALSYGSKKTYNDGDTICKEGHASHDMFVVLSGEIVILRDDINGVPRELATLSPPTMIGQMGLVDGSSRSATCVAKGDVDSLSISQDTFEKILKEASTAGSAFRHLLLASMTNQLATANDKIRGLITDMEKEQDVEKNREMEEWRKKLRSESQPKESSSERLLKIAGVLDGWNVDSEGVDDMNIDFLEDEDMKRTREARQKGR